MAPRTEDQFEEIREKSREKIVSAALELFARQGFHKTSMSEVAKAAGVSKGLIYNYFDSKDDLLLAVFEVGLKDADQLFAAHNEDDPRLRFKNMLQDAFTMAEVHKDYYRLITTLIIQPMEIEPIKPFLDAVAAGKKTAYTQLFKEMGYEDAENEAMFCGAIMDGIMLGWYVLGDDYPMEAMKQRILSKYCESANEQL